MKKKYESCISICGNIEICISLESHQVHQQLMVRYLRSLAVVVGVSSCFTRRIHREITWITLIITGQSKACLMEELELLMFVCAFMCVQLFHLMVFFIPNLSFFVFFLLCFFLKDYFANNNLFI